MIFDFLAALRRYLGGFVQFLIGLILVAMAMIFEPLLFPVVTGWKPTKVEVAGDVVRISGYMHKARDCRFLAVQASGFDPIIRDNIHIPILFQDNPNDQTATRPAGYQSWGPWQIEIPRMYKLYSVDFRSVHNCHGGWTTVTYLGNVVVRE